MRRRTSSPTSTTGEVLAAKSAHEPLPPASTLKMLTALTLLPELDKEQVVVGTDEEVLVEGSKVGIATGLSYTVDLLFTAMLIDSGNDAAQALARAGGGVELHRRRDERAGAGAPGVRHDVVNPSGLDEPGQVTLGLRPGADRARRARARRLPRVRDARRPPTCPRRTARPTRSRTATGCSARTTG